MDYFSGLEFLFAGENPHDSGAGTAKTFDDYYGIQYNHSGVLELALDHGKLRRFEGPWAFVTRPGHFFEYHAPKGQERHHVFCCFKGRRTNEFIKHGLLSVKKSKKPIRITRPEEFLNSMRELRRNLQLPSRSGVPRAVLLLEDLLLQMQQQPPVPESRSRRLLLPIQELADAVRRGPQNDFDFKFEARKLGVSYPYLRKLFIRFIGVPPHRLVLEWRLRRGAEFLLNSEEQISAIAEMCGFRDRFYFSRAFRSQYRLSPLQYRQKFRF